jgi:hypothetical protein
MLIADNALNLQNNDHGWPYAHEKMDEIDAKKGQKRRSPGRKMPCLF